MQALTPESRIIMHDLLQFRTQQESACDLLQARNVSPEKSPSG
jgi:hypothetical protein